MTDDDGFKWYSGGERIERYRVGDPIEKLEAALDRLAEVRKRKAILKHAASDVWPEDDPDIWKRLGLEKPHE